MKRDLSIVVINLPWTALATLEVRITQEESQVQKPQSVSRRTLEHSLQGAMAGSALAAGLAVPAVSVFLMLDGWQVVGHYS